MHRRICGGWRSIRSMLLLFHAGIHLPLIIALPIDKSPTVLLSFNATMPLEDLSQRQAVLSSTIAAPLEGSIVPLEDSVERKALVPDHGWAEVMRFATNCSAVAEGLSTGFNTDCGKEYVELGRPELASCNASHPPAKVGYGCWFFFSTPGSLAPEGSGVGVNVGRSLRVDTRAEASKMLGLPCADPPLCEKPGHVQDKLYCERAVERGYDSIQFARPHRTCLHPHCPRALAYGIPPEVVICNGGCMTQAVASACPPETVQLKRLRSRGPCECSNRSHVLNCGRNAHLYGRPDDGEQRCPVDIHSRHFHHNISAPELYDFLKLLVEPIYQPHLMRHQHNARRRLERFQTKPPKPQIAADASHDPEDEDD